MNNYLGISGSETIVRGQAIIWQIELDVPDIQLEDYFNLLSQDERIKANRFKFKRDKKNYVVCRGVLRILIGCYLGIEPTEIIFEYSEFKKPYFGNATNLNFNVSHSGKLGIIGFFMNNPIGVDIEFIKTDFDVMDLANNFFSTKEINMLKEIPEHDRALAFYRCWTRKESFIKAEGSGLSFPLDAFAVSLHSDEEATLLETNWSKEEKEDWFLHSFVPSSNYRAAFAVKDQVDSISYRLWEH